MRKRQRYLAIIPLIIGAVGCGQQVEKTDEIIMLQTLAIEETANTEGEAQGGEGNGEDHLLPVPEELKSMERGSPEWQKGMEAYCGETAAFWREIVERIPLKWGEEIPELGPHEAMSMLTGWNYLNLKGGGSILYQLHGFHVIAIGGGINNTAEYFPKDGIEEIIIPEKKGEGDGYYTKFHGIFANGGDGELDYRLEDAEGNILWEHTLLGEECDQIFIDIPLKEGTYTLYTEIKSGNPFPNSGEYEVYRFTEEENKRAMEQYAQFHGGSKIDE